MGRDPLKIGPTAAIRTLMADGIYLGMNGAAARLAQLDRIADNLANAETPGFRASRARFEAFLPDGAAAGTPAYVAATDTVADARRGEARVTGRSLDVRLDGDAWLTVQLPDGGVAYTRDGRLEVDDAGRLLAAGLPVLGESGAPILAPPGAAVQVGNDGSVLAEGQRLDGLGLAQLQEPRRLGAALVGADVAVPTTAAVARVRPGELEGSNAHALEATIDLVAAQRAYDNAMQAIQTSRRLDERAAEAGRIRS